MYPWWNKAQNVSYYWTYIENWNLNRLIQCHHTPLVVENFINIYTLLHWRFPLRTYPNHTASNFQSFSLQSSLNNFLSILDFDIFCVAFGILMLSMNISGIYVLKLKFILSYLLFSYYRAFHNAIVYFSVSYLVQINLLHKKVVW